MKYEYECPSCGAPLESGSNCSACGCEIDWNATLKEVRADQLHQLATSGDTFPCPDCETPIEPGQDCPHCGYKVNWDRVIAAKNAAAMSAAPLTQTIQDPKERLKKRIIAFSALAAAIAVIVVAVVIISGLIGWKGLLTRELMPAIRDNDTQALVDMISPSIEEACHASIMSAHSKTAAKSEIALYGMAMDSNVFKPIDGIHEYFAAEDVYDLEKNFSWKILSSAELSDKYMTALRKSFTRASFNAEHVSPSFTKAVQVKVEISAREGGRTVRLPVYILLTEEKGAWYLYKISTSSILAEWA